MNDGGLEKWRDYVLTILGLACDTFIKKYANKTHHSFGNNSVIIIGKLHDNVTITDKKAHS